MLVVRTFRRRPDHSWGAGYGALVEQNPFIEQFARYGGASFLVGYGLLILYSAYHKNHSLRPAEEGLESK